MSTNVEVRNPAAEALAITALALKYENLTDLPDILGEIGEATGSFAVILWELAPDVELTDESQPLFVLAHWLKNGEGFASHTLPLRSCVGASIRTQETVICPDDDQRIFKGPPDFIGKYGIRSIVSIPLRFRDSERGDSGQGSLTLYRTDATPISDSAHSLAEALAQVLPGIYSGLREKSSLRMVGKLNGIIQEFEEDRSRLEHSTAKAALDKMALAIRDGFRCLEVSIYLVQAEVNPKKARLEATTFPPYIRQHEYWIGAPGITGWVLQQRQPVRIFDLTFFDRDLQRIQARYPGLTGFHTGSLVQLTKKELNVGADVSLPPFSFMAAPILVGSDLLGVIRCCTPLRAPYYYGDRDEKLLALAASQIGHYWRNWVQLGAIKNDNRSWEALVTSLNELISGVSSQAKLEERPILEKFLNVAHGVIPGAAICDVRLYNPEKRDLYFAAKNGKAWEGKPPELASMRFPLSDNSAGAWVFNNKTTRIMADVSDDELYSGLFPEVKSMVIVPIASGSECYGVLDVRITSDMGIPPNTRTIAEALGRQLGLYLHLLRTLGKVRDVERSLKQNVARLQEAESIQTRAFEDLEHQLRLPVLQAHSRLSKLLAQELSADKIVSNVKAIRGLFRKADRVVRGMGMFVTLAKGQPLKLQPKRLFKGSLVRLLIEICMDCVFLEGIKSRGLTFHVNDATFSVLDTTTVQCDPDLLEQATYDIVDNACKYSFSFEKIVVSGGLNREGRFYISVVNRGLELREEDIPKVAKRGWRGPNALLATGQGSGIGCWFADEVMRAHGGRLSFFATTPERSTEVRLQF